MSKENLNALVARFIALLLMLALFLFLLFPQKSQVAFANPHSSSWHSIAPIFSPPEPFQVSSSKFQGLSRLATASIVSTISTALVDSSLGSVFSLFASSASESSKNLASINPSTALVLPAGSVRFDFDGDGKADIGRWQSSTQQWIIKHSSNGTFTPYGIGQASSLIAPADFDGDSKTDVAAFSSGTWSIRKSSNGQIQTISLGTAGDKPVAGDYDGDGLADAAVWRNSNGTWYVKQSTNGATVSFPFGVAGDIPVAGNYDGDSRMDYAVFRPSDGIWYVWFSSTNNYTGWNWGLGSDIPVPADYDGDGKTDYAVYRGSTGAWYVLKSSTNNTQYVSQTWGNYGDQPTPADYDNDGKADYSIWRPTTGVWHTIKSNGSGYDYQTLGQAGDVAVPSAYLKQIGGQLAGYDLAKARLNPKNATGGTDLYSRNFSWGTSLFGLPGRAGLDGGFGISYNSLVWTKEPVSNSIYFDADNSNISPGFRFGFPVIEPFYYNPQTSRYSFLMVSPSGARTEFRQIGASSIYEAADSSYTQIEDIAGGDFDSPPEDFTLVVKTTDGTKMTYLWKAGAYRCSQIKDANGNFISVNHDEQGLLRTVTDTLGRIITVIYDAELYPTSVVQTWKTNNGAGATTTHTSATFTYTNIITNPNFAPGLTSFGPSNGTTLKVLWQVIAADGSLTQFDYNAYGQVYKIRNYAADWHLLSYVKTDLESPAAGQTDCPRFSETSSWTENFNQNSQGVAQETVITNSIQENQTYNVGGNSGSATLIQVSMTNHPNNLISKTFVGNSGWQEGLPLATEDCISQTCTGTDRKRWTWTNWTQDDTTKTYIVNPRVIETKVGDTTNTKRTTVEYYPTSQGSPVVLYGLVKEVKVFDTNQTTVLKRATTEYNLNTVYTSRRILGLPSKSELFDETGFLTAKVTYNYDEENFAQEPEQNIAPINHDTANFGTNFIIGRGNLTSQTRWDVNFPENSSQAVISKVRYDIAGSIVAQIDALNRKVKINYTDSFNDNQSRNSFAYPTKLTDAAGNFSEVKYRFDIGANVWAKSPAPQNQTSGKITERLFDTIGRLSKETLLNSGAYTRYEYPTNQIQAKIYSTIIDTNGNGADANDEVLAESWMDGAGRVRQSRTEHPGCFGGFSGSLVEYDILGRTKRSTIPTEIDANWTPSGDDLTRGWLWQSNEYDWKGRVTRAINTDGTDTIASYDGCGCAGGQITTIKGENIVETDWQGNNPVNLGRRTQKVYADIQGRSYKTEVMNWDGTTPYATTVETFNGRDQITNTRQYAGSTNSLTYRDVQMTYDGHGRMKTRHYPIEDVATNTTWNYNADDSIQMVIDPRGVITNFAYYPPNGLVQTISYNLPNGSTIPNTSNVTFSYDNLGNRTQMTDGTGTTTYAYNQLSQMTSETKTFSGVSGNFTINYGYTLSGGLKSYSDPQDSTRQIIYNFDKIGRIVGADQFAQGVTTQAVFGTKFRAWGAIKEYQYNEPTPNGTRTNYINYNYDNRSQISGYESGGAFAVHDTMAFERYADGKLKKSINGTVLVYDRFFKYDQVGRLMQGLSGRDANGTAAVDGPYKQDLSYNGFSEVTLITGKHWQVPLTNYAKTYQNGRANLTGYDAAGNIVQDRIRTSPTILNRTLSYDAAGRQVQTFDPKLHSWENDVTITDSYDGNGWQVKHQRVGSLEENTLSMRSTVLGGEVVGTLNLNNQVKTFTATVNGMKIEQNSGGLGTRKWTSPKGLREYNGGEPITELDPRGADVGLENPYNVAGGDGGGSYPGFGDATNYSRCAWEGLAIPCERQARLFESNGYKYSFIERKPNGKGLTDSPLPKAFGGSSSGLAYTAKPEDAPTKGRVIKPSSIPTEDPTNVVATVDVPISFDESLVDASVGLINNEIGFRQQTRQQLPQCIRDFLRPFFPNVQIGNFRTFSPVDDARFISGLPTLAKDVTAITLGLYDIHFNPGKLDLTGGQDKSSIGILAEEIAHTVQFIGVWEEIVNGHPGKDSLLSDYQNAQTAWKSRYLAESIKIEAKNVGKIVLGKAGIYLPSEDSYKDNKYEKEAKATRKIVQTAVDSLQKSPCYP